MTAVRTNPQQIREVRIDSEKTVGELLELVRIVYEYGDVRGSLLNEAGASQSPEAKLKERIHVRDLLTVNYTDKSITPIYLEVLEEFDGSSPDSRKIQDDSKADKKDGIWLSCVCA